MSIDNVQKKRVGHTPSEIAQNHTYDMLRIPFKHFDSAALLAK